MKYKLIFTLFSLFFFSEQSIAQSNQKIGKSDFVTEMSKFLARQYDISFLRSKKDVYAFNLRIQIKRAGKIFNVQDIRFTDSIGYKVFPDYLQLKKMSYNGLTLKSDGAVTLIVPILILNNAKAGQNPAENNIVLSNNSLIRMVSALLYPDTLQKNITTFPLFTIRRMDIE
ncbi:hypothetical protein [uncultured Pedobacter sp.]|uniref:hypothetical protein n=1 Tax=uncultured Pedobacter sp. TaxID=246139 RepID=UPI0025D87DBA|nr:hypothetical protein [uncultured Pedobacter sp.]